MRLLMIIPAYNEAKNIERVVHSVQEIYPEYDYIVVNDGSKDNTAQICKLNHFNYLDLPINLGLSGGIQAGMKYAYQYGYDAVIQIDGDGQHQASYIKKLVECMEDTHADIVIGSRFKEVKKEKSIRMLGSEIIRLLIKLTTHQNIMDPTSGMRAYNQKAIWEFNRNASLTPEPDTLVYMIKKGLKIKEVQVEMKEREFGESYLNPIRSIKYMVNMIFSILFIRSITRKNK